MPDANEHALTLSDDEARVIRDVFARWLAEGFPSVDSAEPIVLQRVVDRLDVELRDAPATESDEDPIRAARRRLYEASGWGD
jgi:hypothetical protein